MQDYGEVFSKIYNARWSQYASSLAPSIIEFYNSQAISKKNKNILDLGCGSGQLAASLLAAGYNVTGIDKSEFMLEIARKNNSAYLPKNRAEFYQADITSFEMNKKFGLAVATFNTLNHLSDLDELKKCLKCVINVMDDNGLFLFDLNTSLSLKKWNNLVVEDTEDCSVVQYGIYEPGMEKAYTRIKGFVKNSNGMYENFVETLYNTPFNSEDVEKVLKKVGWKNLRYPVLGNFGKDVINKKSEEMICLIVSK